MSLRRSARNQAQPATDPSTEKEAGQHPAAIVVNGTTFSTGGDAPVVTKAETSPKAETPAVKTEIEEHEPLVLPVAATAEEALPTTEQASHATLKRTRSTSQDGSPSNPRDRRHRSRSNSHAGGRHEFKDKTHRNRCRVFIGNLAKGVTRGMLEDVFSAYGKMVERPRIIHKGKANYAFVQYSNPEDAGKALHRAEGIELEGLAIDVKPAAVDMAQDTAAPNAKKRRTRDQATYEERYRPMEEGEIPPLLPNTKEVPPMWRTQLCHHYESTGKCPFQKTGCHYAHGPGELRDSRGRLVHTMPATRRPVNPDCVVLCLGTKNENYASHFRRELERYTTMVVDSKTIRPSQLADSLSSVHRAGIHYAFVCGDENERKRTINFKDFTDEQHRRFVTKPCQVLVDMLAGTPKWSRHGARQELAPPPLLRPPESRSTPRMPPSLELLTPINGRMGSAPLPPRQQYVPPHPQQQQYAPPQQQSYAPQQQQPYAPPQQQQQPYAPPQQQQQPYAPPQQQQQPYAPPQQQQQQPYAPPQQQQQRSYAPLQQPYMQPQQQQQYYGQDQQQQQHVYDQGALQYSAPPTGDGSSQIGVPAFPTESFSYQATGTAPQEVHLDPAAIYDAVNAVFASQQQQHAYANGAHGAGGYAPLPPPGEGEQPGFLDQVYDPMADMQRYNPSAPNYAQ